MSFKKGIFDSVPIAIAFFFVFSSIGAVYHNHGISLFNTLVSTLFLFSAPLQMALVDIIGNNNLYSAAALTMIINFRIFIMAMASNRYYQGVSKMKLYPSLMMFSGSSFIVCDLFFKSEHINEGKAQFNYYLGVCTPPFLVAVLSTFIGYEIIYQLNSDLLKNSILMVIPIYFTILSSKTSKEPWAFQSVLLGGLLTPVLMSIDNDYMTILSPLLAGMIIAPMALKPKGKKS